MNVRKFATNTIFIFGTRIGNLVLGLLSSILLARSLGPEGNGTYSLVILLPTLVITFTNFGVGPATVYYVAQKKIPRKNIVETSLIINFVLGLLGCIIGLSLIQFSDSTFPNVPHNLLVLSLILIPLGFFFSEFGTKFLLGDNKIKEYNLISFGKNLLSLFTLYIFFILFGSETLVALWSRIISTVVISLILIYSIVKRFSLTSIRLHTSYLKHLFNYGIKVYIGNIIGFLNTRAEIFLLGFFLPIYNVGFYTIAVSIAEKLWLVSQSAATLIFPIISEETDEQKRKSITPLVSRTVLLITAIGAGFLFLIADWFIPLLFSKEFIPSVKVFRILLPGIVILSSARILTNDIAGRGLPNLNTIVGGIGLVIQVSLNLFLIPSYGIVGSAWASTVSYLFKLIGNTIIYIKITRTPTMDLFIPKSKDFSLYVKLIRNLWRNARAVNH